MTDKELFALAHQELEKVKMQEELSKMLTEHIKYMSVTQRPSIVLNRFDCEILIEALNS